ncbi:MAG TPA: glycosyltransferase, partial [Methylomirabilota bacterium]|nr:glycosyltransferase [Methylomirabilota bacterium]
MAGHRAARAAAGRRVTAADSASPVASPLDLSIVLPVYNEEENLPLLWPEIRQVLEPTRLRYEVIFVDDGSRDR